VGNVRRMWCGNGSDKRSDKYMYDGSTACIRVNLILSEWLEVKQGVRQGCVMSPWVFNVFMDKCVRAACMNTSGIKVWENLMLE
jgi:hypothetical protein